MDVSSSADPHDPDSASVMSVRPVPFAVRVASVSALIVLLASLAGGPLASAQDAPDRALVIEQLEQWENRRHTLAEWVEAGADPRDRRVAMRPSYLATMRPILMAPLARELEAELQAWRQREPDGFDWYVGLARTFHVYRILCARVTPDRAVLEAHFVPALRRYALGDSEPTDDIARLVEDHARTVAALIAADHNLRHTAEWKVPTDSRTSLGVEISLGVPRWVDAAWEEIVTTQAERYPDLTRDTLVPDIPGRDRIVLPEPVPGLFTQRAFDDTLRPAFEDYAERIARHLEVTAVRNRWEPTVIVNHFCRRLSVATRLAWVEFYRAAEFAPFADLDDSVTTLRLLASADSPLRVLFWTVWAKRPLDLAPHDAWSLRPAGNPGQWIPDTLDVVDRLADTVEALVTAIEKTEGGIVTLARHNELARLTLLFRASGPLFRSALDTADPEMTTGILNLFGSLVRHLRAVVGARLVAGLNAHWRRVVVEPFAELTDRFPFDPEGTADADPAAVHALLGPGGSVAQALQLARQVRKALPEVGPGGDYRRLDTALERAAGVLIGANGEPVTELVVELTDPPRARDVTLVLGETTVRLADLRPDLQGIRRCLLRHKPSDGERAAITATLDGREVAIERTGPWALMRLLGSADEFERVAPDRVQYSWYLDKPADGADEGDDGDNDNGDDAGDGGDDADENAARVAFRLIAVQSVQRRAPAPRHNPFAGLTVPDEIVRVAEVGDHDARPRDQRSAPRRRNRGIGRGD